MNSFSFIKQAKELTKKIGDLEILSLTGNITREKEQIQQDVNALFAQMSNPSLPSAYHLYKAATKAGLDVDRRVSSRIQHFA